MRSAAVGLDDAILNTPNTSESERTVTSAYVRVGGGTDEGEEAGNKVAVNGEFNRNLK